MWKSYCDPLNPIFKCASIYLTHYWTWSMSTWNQKQDNNYSTCCPIRCFREFSFRCNATPLYGLAVDVQALIITIRCRTEADCEVACTCESQIVILHEIFATLEAPWIGVRIKNALKTITVPFSFQFPIFVPIFDTIATLVIFVFMCEHPV